MAERRTGDIRILYEEGDERFACMIEETAAAELPALFEFFRIGRFSRPKTVQIYPTAEAYRAYKLASSGHYEEWMIGEQKGDTIRVLSHRACVLLPDHEGQTEEDFRKLVLHELVHACQQETGAPEREETEWFWEALATNLAEQYGDIVPITCQYEDLLYRYENIDCLYETFFTLGKYLMTHSTPDALYAWITDPELLLKEGAELFAAALAWSAQTA